MKLIPVDRKLPLDLQFQDWVEGRRVEEYRNEEFGLTVTRTFSPPRLAIGALPYEADLRVDGLDGQFRSVAEANVAIQAHLEQPPRSVAEWPVDANGSPIEDMA